MIKLDETDLAIMRATQAGLPLTRNPTSILLNNWLTTEAVMTRMTAMQEQGIIRRIGAVPNTINWVIF